MRIGNGAVGKVYLAKLEGEQELFAIKSMEKQHLKDVQMVQNVKKEAEILLMNDNPFMCDLLYYFEDRKRVYYVMPFIRGGNLIKLNKNHDKLPEKAIKMYIAQLAYVIGHLHSKNIIHRDIKLENIMIEESGYLKLIDFGVSKKLTSQAQAQTLVGTDQYMAPEIVCGKPYDYSVDWWALGVVTYALATGYMPYSSESRLELNRLIVAAEDPWDKEDNPSP